MLVDALRAKGWSDRDAGRAVLVAWKLRERLGEYPQPAAIAARIGRLKKGDATWWLNHGPALAAFAELLYCKPDDLLPEGTEPRPAEIDFAEFNELAGLLPGQDPCAVNPDGWLGAYVEAALEQGGRWWFVVPPGGGKSLAIRVLRQRHGAKAVVTSVRALFEAAREAREGMPLVVEVDHADSACDVAAFAEISRRAEPTCILAPFERPVSTPNDGWNACTSALHHNWREQLVGWLRARVPAADRLDTNAILTWLDSVDPSGRVFASPGDIVTIVARVYRAGLPQPSVALTDLASEWLSQTLGGESDPWLRRLGSDAIKNIVGERVRRVDLALEPLSTSTWAELLPESVLRPRNEPTSTRRGKKGRRNVIREPELVSTNARDAIHALADKGVLRTTVAGGLEVFPNWVRAGLERSVIQGQVRSGSAAAWGLWTNDASRKDVVDDALDALGPNELVRAASKISSETELASIAASEALFSAFGRRFAISAWRPTGEAIAVLQSLGLRQLRLLDRNAKLGAPLPTIALTRHRPNFGSRWQTDWWRETWTFSFAVPKPGSVKRDPAWSLPGWADALRLEDAPNLPHMLGKSKNQLPDNDPWVLGVLRTARSAVRASQNIQLPDDVDLSLLTWVVIDGPLRGWRIGKTLAKRLIGTRVLDHVHELLQRESHEVRAAAVAEVWRAVLQLDDYANPLHALRMLRDGHRAFFDLLTVHLPLDVFRSALASIDLVHAPSLFTRLLLELPDRLSRLVIRVIAEQARTSKQPIGNIDADVVAAFGHDQLDVLVDLAAELFAIGGVAAKRAWELDQHRSIDETLKALDTGVESASTWFFAAPPGQLPRLLDALGGLSTRPPWAQRWLATVLSPAGMMASRVFEMMAAHATQAASGT